MTTRAATDSRRAFGFSLIELMAAVAIATILVTIALPAFTSQIRKSRRTEARTALLDLAARAERLYATTNSYQNATTGSLSPSDLGYAGSWPITVGSGYYSISLPTSTPSTFAFRASAISSQANDTQCATFSVDNTGKQLAHDSSSNDTTTTCWH